MTRKGCFTSFCCDTLLPMKDEWGKEMDDLKFNWRNTLVLLVIIGMNSQMSPVWLYPLQISLGMFIGVIIGMLLPPVEKSDE